MNIREWINVNDGGISLYEFSDMCFGLSFNDAIDLNNLNLWPNFSIEVFEAEFYRFFTLWLNTSDSGYQGATESPSYRWEYWDEYIRLFRN